MGIYIIYTGMFHMNQEYTKYHLQPKLICRACPVTDLFWKRNQQPPPLCFSCHPRQVETVYHHYFLSNTYFIAPVSQNIMI